MKRVKIITIALILPFLYFSCESTSNEEVKTDHVTSKLAKDVSPEKFKSLITSEVMLLDVRTPEEYNVGHLSNSVNINFFDEDFMSQVEKLDQSKVVLVYCASGGRSSKTMKKLSEKGFETVYNLLGGITKWNELGYPTVK